MSCFVKNNFQMCVFFVLLQLLRYEEAAVVIY